MNKKLFPIIVVLSILTNFYAYFYLTNKVDVVIQEYAMIEVETAVKDPAVLDLLQRQKIVDEQIKKASESNDYTIDSPLIINNPYGNSPLSALAIFKTPYPAKIIVKVGDNDAKADVLYATYEHGFTTNHVVPIYGLEADKENQVTLRTINKFWLPSESVIRVKTESVDVGKVEIIKENFDTMDEKYMITYSDSKITLRDLKGTVHWFLNAFNVENTAVLYAQNSFVGRIEVGAKKYLAVFDMMGRLDKIIDNQDSYGPIQLLPGGVLMSQKGDNSLLLVNPMNGESEIIDFAKHYSKSKIKQYEYDGTFERYYVLFEDQTLITVNERTDTLYYNSNELINSKAVVNIEQFSLNQSKTSWSDSEIRDVVYLDKNTYHVNYYTKKNNTVNFIAEVKLPFNTEINYFKILDYNQIMTITGNQLIVEKRDGTITYEVKFDEAADKVQFYNY